MMFPSIIPNQKSISIISLGGYPNRDDLTEEVPLSILQNHPKETKIVFSIDSYYNRIDYNHYQKLYREQLGIDLIKVESTKNASWTLLTDRDQKLWIYHIPFNSINNDIENKWLVYLKEKQGIDTPLLISNNLKTSSHYYDENANLHNLDEFSPFWNDVNDYMMAQLKLGNPIYINNRAVFNSKYPGMIPIIELTGSNLSIQWRQTHFCSNLYLESQPELASILYKLHNQYRRQLFYSYNKFRDGKILVTHYI